MNALNQDVPEWYVPVALKKAITNKQKKNTHIADDKVKKFSVILDKLRKIDRLKLSECHYIEFLKLGLYLEQYQQISDLKKFSLVYTRIDRVPDIIIRNKFRINISIINEDNPILNVSDSLKVYEYLGNKKYFLKVANIQRNHVVAIANRKFCAVYSPLKRYNVDLVFNDYTFRCAHDTLSVSNIESIRPYIFPRKNSQIRINTEVNNNERSWFNNEISENPEQKQAVLNICNKSAFPAPYILYGPPGTGKTATVVEAVCQIWKDSEEHILICAPSNAACDVVTRRILEFIKHNELYRIYSQGKDYSTISADIKNCCNYDYEGFALELDHNVLVSKRIIITTLSSSAKLILLKLKVKFSHIFIDEAGQATQPDALLPVDLMTVTKSSECQIVISGDPQQLGPCIRSKLAEPILGESILEKLMRHEPYKKAKTNGYNPKYITKLIRNYRSSLDIIHVSNELFYDNELIACSTKKLNKFPIIFHAVNGKEKKVSSSTSSYNQLEIDRVLRYVDEFINTKIEGKQFTAKDIGIVTPFSLQSLKLRKELEKKKLSGIDVGTVEIFQGQEKEIIIVSTVRSEKFHHDKGEHIGFLSNPRRFNVALTRPKTFLVVVGNPNALQVDHCWKSFLKFCKEKNACRGDDFTLNEDIIQLFPRLNLGSRSKWSEHLFDRKLKLFEKDHDLKKEKYLISVLF